MAAGQEVGIGIDMGGTRIKIGVVHDGKILYNTKVEAAAHVSLQQRLSELADIIDQVLLKPGYRLTGIGVAFPGIVDSVNSRILSKYVKYPDAQGVDLRLWAQQRWNVPLVAENDARAALVGEWQYGAGKDCNDLLLVTLGTGVGTAVMMDGRMLRGKHYLAGNLGGHMTINLNGNVCNCGNIGCLESEGSTWALDRNIRHAPGFHNSALSKADELSFHAVFTLANEGDALALQTRDHCLRAWSLGIISLVHAYDPQRIVIGGGIMKSKDLILPYVKEMVDRYSWSKDNGVEIVAAEQVEFAGILGMYHLITEYNKENRARL